MKYVYRCKNDPRCLFSDWIERGKDAELELLVNHDNDGQLKMDTPLMWEVEHGMGESPEIKCPLCDMATVRVIGSPNFYFRGNCYLDKEGCQRDMNIYKLQNDDPYGHMRQPGEVDDMVTRLKKAGTKEGKAKASRKYYSS